MKSLLKLSEPFIFALAILLIFVSEYYYVGLKDSQRAIFIGLWPPTILLILIYVNIKIKK